MLKKILVLFVCSLVVVSCHSCKEKNQQQVEQPVQPPPQPEYEQIPQVQALTSQIEKNQNDPNLYFQRGSAYLQLGNPQGALNDVLKALQLDSINSNYYNLLGKVYYSRQEYTRAINALEQGYELNPGDTAIMMRLARYNLYIDSLQASIIMVDEVLKKNIFNAEAYFLKGMIFKQIGDTAKSISNFQTAVEQNPRYYAAYIQLGLLFSKRKDKLALDYYNNALKIDSSSYEAKYNIAMFYQETKQYDKALEMYRKFIIDFPSDEYPYYNAGYIYFQMDSIDKAIRNFERAMSVAPDYVDAYYMRGLCAEAIKDFKTAKYFYRQALNLNPDHQLATSGYQRMQQY